LKHFKNLFYFAVLCFTALTGLLSYAQNKESITQFQNLSIEVKLSNETLSCDATESVTMTIYKTACFYVHNPKEFYIEKNTEFYIADATNFIPEVTENKNQTVKNKINKITLQEVIQAKIEETNYKKQAPRLVEIPKNNSHNYASSLGMTNKLSTTPNLLNHWAVVVLFETKNQKPTTKNYQPTTKTYSNPTLGLALQNTTPVYNKPPPVIG
jgi:hypothetical protein